MNEEDFLNLVSTYVAEHPQLTAKAILAVQRGTDQALTQALKRAADMEVVASLLAARKYPGSRETVIRKLKQYQGETVLNWDWLTQAPR